MEGTLDGSIVPGEEVCLVCCDSFDMDPSLSLLVELIMRRSKGPWVPSRLEVAASTIDEADFERGDIFAFKVSSV